MRALVLDGAVDPSEDYTNTDSEQYKSFQKAFENYAGFCAAKPNCPLGADPTQATPAFQALVKPLLDTPVTVSDGRPLTFNDAITGVSSALYGDYNWPDLSTALSDLAKGNGDALMAFADQYWERGSDGHYGNLLDVFSAVQCVDDYPRNPTGDHVAMTQQELAAAPFQDKGDPVVVIPNPCDLWPGGPSITAGPVSVPDLPTVVVISTTNDPATPYQNGVDLADQLKARLITVDGTRHTAFLLG